MPYASYQDRLERTRAYNATERGRAVKRAARLRQIERERAARAVQWKTNAAPLERAWRER